MTPTTFHGARLTQVRDVRQWTGTALAERVGVSAGSVSLWEKGAVQPRSTAITELARALEVPEAFFLRPVLPDAPRVFRFRSLSSATKRARAAAQVRVEWLHEIVSFLSAELDLPNVMVPEFDLPADPVLLSAADIETAAERTRAAWGLRDGPILDLGKLLESKGISFARIALNAAQLDGLSGWSAGGRPYIAINSEKASATRSRFDAAHELGHLILHRRASERPDAPLHKLLERQAHHFAGAFLFPRTAVADEVAHPDLHSMIELKRRWGLSIGAQVFRLGQLGLVGEAQREHLQRRIGALGWRMKEPLDDVLMPEKPSLLRSAYVLLKENGWTATDIARAVPLAKHDHEQLAGLPSRWMDDEVEHGQLVTLKREQSTGTSTTSTMGTVLPFPTKM